MTTSIQLNEIINSYSVKVSKGLTLKSVARDLSSKNISSELITKLVRLIEINVKHKGL